MWNQKTSFSAPLSCLDVRSLFLAFIAFNGSTPEEAIAGRTDQPQSASSWIVAGLAGRNQLTTINKCIFQIYSSIFFHLAAKYPNLLVANRCSSLLLRQQLPKTRKIPRLPCSRQRMSLLDPILPHAPPTLLERIRPVRSEGDPTKLPIEFNS